jgi:NAD(P)-dependent dehydrogenase (short-subunit alcohol dehydrogenase family)/acyl carrier protein
VVDEILADPLEHHVAVRGGRRWTLDLQRLEQDLQPAAGRERGHYLVVGGLGTIGFTLAWSLARGGAAYLSIVSRTALPPRTDWQALLDARGPADPMVARTLRVASIEKLGCEVLPIAADAADADAMRSAIAAAEARFGPLHGVITAAGLMDDSAFAPLNRFDAAAAERHVRPKVDGLPALAEALGNRPLDFCIVTSSLSSVLGGFGYAAYAGANAFLDAFVHERNLQAGTRWSVVNWDAWHPLDGLMTSTTSLGRLAMSPAEGATAFGRLLKCRGISQVFVSTSDLPERIAEYVNLGPVRGEAIPPIGDEEPRAADIEQLDEEPLSPTEQTIIAIWQQVLGIPGILVHDSFMDLGGSSLTAIQVIGRIDEQLGVKVSIEEFIFQTAGQLAALCDARLADGAPRDGAPAGTARPIGAWARLRTVLNPRGVEEEKEVRT